MPQVTLSELTASLAAFSFRFGTELDLQDDIEQALGAAGVNYVREHSFSKQERIDFYLPDVGIGIECKTEGSLAQVAAQLIRYAKHDAVQGLLLVSRRRTHGGLPSEIQGKPTAFLWAGGGRL